MSISTDDYILLNAIERLEKLSLEVKEVRHNLMNAADIKGLYGNGTLEEYLKIREKERFDNLFNDQE